MGRRHRISFYWNVSDIQQNNTLVNIPAMNTNTDGNQSSIRLSQATLYNRADNTAVGVFHTTEHNFILSSMNTYSSNRHFTYYFNDSFFNIPSSYLNAELFSTSSSLLLANGTYYIKPTSISGYFSNKKHIRIKQVATDIDRTITISYKNK